MTKRKLAKISLLILFSIIFSFAAVAAENATVEKTVLGNSTVVIGSTAQFMINITNTGTSELEEVELRDGWNSSYMNLTGWSDVIGDFGNFSTNYNEGEASWLVNISIGNSAILLVNFTTYSTGNTTNEADMENSTADTSCPGDGDDSCELDFDNALLEIISLGSSVENATIEKTLLNGPISVGDTAQFMVNVTNTGNVDITEAEIRDAWNSSYINYTTFSTSSDIIFDGANYNGSEAFWLVNISIGNSAILLVNFTTYSTGNTTNEADMESSNGSTIDMGSEEIEIMPLGSSVENATIEKRLLNGPSIENGSIAQFMINITNTGNINLTNYGVFDDYDNTSLVVDSYTGDFEDFGDAGEWDVNLTVGQSQLYFINFTAISIGNTTNSAELQNSSEFPLVNHNVTFEITSVPESPQATFNFTGIVYDDMGNTLDGANISVDVWNNTQEPTYLSTVSTLTDGSGQFIIEIPEYDPVDDYVYKTTVFFDDGNNIFAGKAPMSLLKSQLVDASPAQFHLAEGTMINVSFMPRSGELNDGLYFQDVLKDGLTGVRVGGIDGKVDPDTCGPGNGRNHTNMYVPTGRDYTVRFNPCQGESFSRNILSSDLVADGVTNKKYNASQSFTFISGQVSGSNYDKFHINNFGFESDSNIEIFGPNPSNSEAAQARNDTYDKTTGFFNISIPGKVDGIDILLFFVAENSSGRYAAFRNYTVTYDQPTFDIGTVQLYEMQGDVDRVIKYSSRNSTDDILQNTTDITEVSFLLVDESGSPATDTLLIEASFEYDYAEMSDFSVLLEMPGYDHDDVLVFENGNFSVPVLEGGDVKIKIYSPKFSVKEYDISSDAISALNPGESIELELTNYTSGDISGSLSSDDIFIEFLEDSPECSVPDYDRASCTRIPRQTLNDFDYIDSVLGVSEANIVVGRNSTGLSVMFVGAEMYTSGALEALFDADANTSGSGNSLEEAWRFGSMGPDIYEEILISMPYNDSFDEDSLEFSLKYLYDQEWNKIWDVSSNGTNVTLEDYEDYDSELFEGVACSQTNKSSLCYINITTNMAWINVPHFSGVGPVFAEEEAPLVENATITKTALEDNVENGRTAQFIINVTNTGTANLSDVQIKDRWNSSLINYSSYSTSDDISAPIINYTANEIMWTLNLSTGDSKSLLVNFTALAVGNASNEAEIQNSTDEFDEIAAYVYISAAIPPVVTLISPGNESDNPTGSVDFRYNVTDNIAGNANCSLYIDGSKNISMSALIGAASQTFSSVALSDGHYEWYVNCTDADNNIGVSGTYELDVDTAAPILTLNTTDSESVDQGDTITIFTSWNYGNSELSSGIIYVDGTAQGTNNSPENGGDESSTGNITLSYTTDADDSGQTLNVYVSVNDTNGRWSNSSLFNIEVNDTITPAAILILGNDTAEFREDNISISYYANDTNLVEWHLNITNSSGHVINSDSGNSSVNNSGIMPTSTFDTGNYTATLYAEDISENTNITSSNFSVVDTTAPDVSLSYPENSSKHTSANITFRYIVTSNFDSESVNCSLYIDGLYNQSEIVTTDGSVQEFTAVYMADGEYGWNVSCEDAYGNKGDSEIFDVTIDTADPYYSSYNRTAIAGTDNAYAWVNFTDSLTDVENVLLYYSHNGGTYNTVTNSSYDESTLWNVSVPTPQPFNPGMYMTVYFWANDSAGNFNQTGMLNISATDEDAPTVSLTSPANRTWTNADSMDYICDVNDASDIVNVSLYGRAASSASWGNPIFTNTSGIKGAYLFSNIQKLPNTIAEWNCEACDNFGNCGWADNNRTITFDDTVPELTLNTASSYSKTTTPLFNFSVEDNLDDVLSCDLYIDGSAEQSDISVNNGTSITIVSSTLSQGNHTWNVSCEDEADNINHSEERWVFIDNIKPVTVMGYNNSADSSWVNSDTLVNFTVTESGSGTGYTQIKNASGEWENVTDGFVLDANLTNNILYYRSGDIAGNVENTKQKNFKFDGDAPDSPEVILSTETVNSGGTITVEADSDDQASGLISTADYDILNSSGIVSSGTLSSSAGRYSGDITAPSEEGTYNVSVTVTDNAGNIAADSASQFSVNDTIATITVDNANGTVLRNNSQVEITITGDNGWYNHTGGSLTTITGTDASVTISGGHADAIILEIYANNSAGTVNQNYTYIIDEAVDVTTITAPATDNVNATFAVEATATDNDAGIEKVDFTVKKVGSSSNYAVKEDSSAPYSFNVDSIAAEDGNYSIEATATDNLGNTKTDTAYVVINNTLVTTTKSTDASGEADFSGTDVENVVETITGLNSSSQVIVSIASHLDDPSTSLLSTTVAKLNITADTPGTARVYFTLSVEALSSIGIDAPYSDGDVHVYVDHGSGIEELGQAYYDSIVTKNDIEYARWYFETDDFSIFYFGKKASSSGNNNPGGSGGGGGSSGGNICVPYWDCSAWSQCSDGKQTRTCTDKNGCVVVIGKPEETKTCSVIEKTEEKEEEKSETEEEKETEKEEETKEEVQIKKERYNWQPVVMIALIMIAAVSAILFFKKKK